MSYIEVCLMKIPEHISVKLQRQVYMQRNILASWFFRFPRSLERLSHETVSDFFCRSHSEHPESTVRLLVVVPIFEHLELQTVFLSIDLHGVLPKVLP